MTPPAATAAPSSTGLRPRRNWLLQLAYDGTDYAGWQIQPGQPTIQGELTTALQHLLQTDDLEIFGCSRTDAGVHALAQMVTAVIPAVPSIPPEAAVPALNARLPGAIRVLAASPQPLDFRARHAACGKAYTYVLHPGKLQCPFLARYCWQVPHALDRKAMQAAAEQLLGTHNFSAFSVNPRSTDPVNPECRLAQWHWQQTGSAQVITVLGDRFLYRMVRRLIGFLVEVGRGRLAADQTRGILDGNTAAIAFETAPALGLFLEDVFFSAPPADYRPAPLPFLKLFGAADNSGISR